MKETGTSSIQRILTTSYFEIFSGSKQPAAMLTQNGSTADPASLPASACQSAKTDPSSKVKREDTSIWRATDMFL